MTQDSGPGALQADLLAARIAREATAKGLTVGAAESLTSGAISSTLGKATGASEWFRGGVVAYSTEVKFDVLGVRPGPVVCADCAEQMAHGARRVLGADWVVAVTGAGGPGTEEGQPPGTVFFAVAGPDHLQVVHRLLSGDAADVVTQTIEMSLVLLEQALLDSPPAVGATKVSG